MGKENHGDDFPKLHSTDVLKNILNYRKIYLLNGHKEWEDNYELRKSNL